MLNNGHPSGVIVKEEMPSGGGGGGHMMYGGGHHHPNGGPGDYNPAHSHYLAPSPPNFMNGLGPNHHGGGFCSQMSLNQQSNQPQNSRPLECGGCHAPIIERYYLRAIEQHWHNNCLRCHHCSVVLAEFGESCYTREGMILCRRDYLAMFGSNLMHHRACRACGAQIGSNELVMKAGSTGVPGSSPPFVYHINCFACVKCNVTLQKGDKYAVLNGSVYCEQDLLKIMKNGIGSPSNASVGLTNGPPARKGKVGRPRRSKD